MKGKRTERLIRIASRMLLNPSKQLSLTDSAAEFGVSKTLISDDIEIISEALAIDGAGDVRTWRGRGGGAAFSPSPGPELRASRLAELAETLSVPDRLLAGGLIYYTDIIFDPSWASFLGFTMASMFADERPTVVMTTEVKGIPIAFFTSYALGVPLAVCRFRNRPSDGPAVSVHFPTGSGDVRTLYLGTRFLNDSSRVLIVDDFMRGGGTASGMLLMALEFSAEVVGTGVFISACEARKRDIPNCRSLFDLSFECGAPKLSVSPDTEAYDDEGEYDDEDEEATDDAG